jgi:hypothetical protein
VNIFISWSGTASKTVAEALRSWIPKVIQSARPWLSSTDIESGARWSPEMEEQLRKCTAGILCMTPDNLTAPWLLFEAGALSKTVERPFVCPYLLELEPSDLRAPLSLFQARRANREDTLALLGTINGAVRESPLSREDLHESFDMWWQKLETALNDARKVLDVPEKLVKRDVTEMMEEVLELMRVQERRFAEIAESQRRARATPAVGRLADRLFLRRAIDTQGPMLETDPHLSVNLGLGQPGPFTADELRAAGYEGLLATTWQEGTASTSSETSRETTEAPRERSEPERETG